MIVNVAHLEIIARHVIARYDIICTVYLYILQKPYKNNALSTYSKD